MENQNTPTKIMLTYGLYLGIIAIIISVANYSFGNIYEPHWAVNVVTYLIMIAFIVLGIKAFKEYNNGFLKLGQAIKIGVGIALVYSIISVIYFFIFSNVIEPDFVANMAEFQEQQLYERFPDMDEAMIEQQIEMQKKFMTPAIMSAFMIAGSLLIGLIISLIAGLIMKKEEQYT